MFQPALVTVPATIWETPPFVWTTAKATPGAGAANGDFFPKKQQRVIKWDPFWCDQIMQVYGDFEGFDLQHALFFRLVM